MLNPIVQSMQALLELIFSYELGTNEFTIVLCATLFVMCVVGRVLVGIFGSKHGIFRVSLGVLIPLLLAGLGYALAQAYAVPKIEVEWAAVYLPWVGFGVLFFLGVVFATRRLFEFGPGFCLFLYLLIAGAGAAAYFCSSAVVKFMDESATQLEKREERFTDDIKIVE